MSKINPQGSKVNVIVKLYEKCFHKAYKQWLVASGWWLEERRGAEEQGGRGAEEKF